MIYRGYVITPQYLPGATFTISKEGRVISHKPKKEHIDFYWITQDFHSGRYRAKTIPEAKETINQLTKWDI